MRTNRFETRFEKYQRVVTQYAHGAFISLGVVKAIELTFKTRIL